MPKITAIEGRKILDSRGEPTVEVKITTDSGLVGIDSVPSGASTGKHEAALVNVDAACSNINNIIAPKLKSMEVIDQKVIDRTMLELDGTKNKSKLGGNAILGVSLATARTASLAKKMPLYEYLNQLFTETTGIKATPKVPTPMMVMICGGKHVKEQSEHQQSSWFFRHEEEVKNKLCIQEFSVIGKLEDGEKIWHTLEKMIKERKLVATLGLEGAFSLRLPYDEDAIELLQEAVTACGFSVGQNIKLGMDIAGNHCQMDNHQVIEVFKRHNIFFLEDPFGEEDWEKFGQLKLELDELKKPFLLIGDDIFATHKDLLQKGITQRVANAIIIKPNQVGTLTEMFVVMGIARKAEYALVISHRSGETIDTFIADLAVAVGAEFLKAGAPIPNERLVKYKRLKEIEQKL